MRIMFMCQSLKLPDISKTFLWLILDMGRRITSNFFKLKLQLFEFLSNPLFFLSKLIIVADRTKLFFELW